MYRHTWLKFLTFFTGISGKSYLLRVKNTKKLPIYLTLSCDILGRSVSFAQNKSIIFDLTLKFIEVVLDSGKLFSFNVLHENWQKP